jgi:L-alanine-DL-glutamate epimerase-like enolase superfamily enzyme
MPETDLLAQAQGPVTGSISRVRPEVGMDPHERLAADVRITSVEAIPFSLPYRRPARFASGAVTHADNVLVRVHTDGGLVGQAEAQPRPYTYGETQSSIVTTVRDRLAPLLFGLDPLRTEIVNERCTTVVGNNVARGAVDLALWDLVGKILGRPCSTLLGGFADDVAAAHMVSLEEPGAMAEEAVAVHERLGVRTFKVKVGREPHLDVLATRAIREALPDADLYVDANRGWTYEQALKAGDSLVELGVRVIEEPISVDDRAGRRRLAERWSVPLGGDESCISLAHVDRAIEEGAVRTVSVKTARTGYTESRRILALCLARNVPVLMGSQYEGAVGALATVGFAAAFAATAGQAAELTNYLDLEDDLLVALPDVREGRVAVPRRPGLGVEVDDARLARCRLDS